MHTALLRYINDAGRLYQRVLAPARETSGLTQAELDILLFLANNPEYNTASDIVTVRRLAKSNVSVGIRSLENKGLLLRGPDRKDRRVERLTLTSAALKLAELGQAGQREFGALLLKDFSSEDVAGLKRLMDLIQQNVSHALDDLL